MFRLVEQWREQKVTWGWWDLEWPGGAQGTISSTVTIVTSVITETQKLAGDRGAHYTNQ